MDQNSAVVPGAEVKLLNPATAFARQTTTNDSGAYTFLLLPPGTYSITAQRDGFAPIRVENIVLNVGDQKSLQVHLKAGSITEMVQIEGNAALINESPAVGTVIDRQFVGNLPLNGRSFQSLILLTPGVTITSAGASDPGQFSVNGQRASTNYFTVDGASANVGVSIAFGGAAPATLAGSYPGLSAFGSTSNLVSVDALEEFKIQTSTYSAELGRQPGGQVSLVTRSGGNDFHGGVFEYFRNEALDARDYFNKKPAPQPPLRQNQFGGTFSGPLPFFNFGEGGPFFTTGKDKTFFFFSYEGQRLRLPISGNAIVPSLRLRSAAAPAVKPLLDAFPLPTGPEVLDALGQPTGWSPYVFSVSPPSTLDATSIRIDHRVNSKFTVFGRFNESFEHYQFFPNHCRGDNE
jgi:hypothetical protein